MEKYIRDDLKKISLYREFTHLKVGNIGQCCQSVNDFSKSKMRPSRYLLSRGDCRACLTSSKNMTHIETPIGDEGDTDSPKLTPKSMLEDILSQKLLISDEHPSSICHMCLSMLKLSHRFKLQAEIAEDRIKTQFEPKESKCRAKNIIENTPTTPILIQKIPNSVFVDENDESSTMPCSNEKFTLELHAENENRTDFNVKLDDFQGNNFDIEDFGEITVLEEERTNLEPIREELTDDHIESHEKSENIDVIICRRCAMEYTDEKSFQQHLKKNHNIENPKLVCNQCDFVGKTDSSARYHRKTHLGHQFKCTQCTKSYSTICHLKEHMKKHYNLRTYLCNYCGKGFNYNTSLKYHLRLHTGEKNYTCDYCGLKYRMVNSLKRHIRTHTKEKPYICKFCPKAFCSSGEVKSHQLTHTGEKPYACKYCGKKFAKDVNCKTHYLSHSGRHECTFCPRTFVEAYLLSKHTKQKHKDIFPHYRDILCNVI